MHLRKNVKIYKPSNIHSTAKIGARTKIGAFVDIGKNVEIGEDCNIQCHVTISNQCIIGSRVFIGPNTSLLNDKYPLGKLSPVIVEDDVIIGGGVTILPSVRIEKGAFVGAGSVVTRNVGAGITVVGNPARELADNHI